MPHPTFIRDLGGGLILRRATPEDTDALVAFNAITHSGSAEPDRHVAGHTSDLISGRLATFEPGDFTIVEDTATGQIVSSMSLISQEWAYEGVPFKVGRPEIVGTAPAYRRRGLVRQQFEIVHQWSRQRGELAQAITGNPWYYRQFGYEMAMTLNGGRMGSALTIPKLKTGQSEPYTVRLAEETDLPFMAQVYDQSAQRQPIHCLRGDELWRYELNGRSEHNLNRKVFYIIETQPVPGEAPYRVGFFALAPWLWGTRMWLGLYEILPGTSWLEITPTILRFLWAQGESYAARDSGVCEMFGMGLGEEHPVYDLLPGCFPVIDKPYAWYLRVEDLPAFLRHLSPALSKRLSASKAVGYNGAIKISFYRSGLQLTFADGCLADAAPWSPTQEAWGDAAFPGLTFLQLLFGYRTLEELEYAFPDCWVSSDGIRAVINGLFPKRPSDVWAVG